MFGTASIDVPLKPTKAYATSVFILSQLRYWSCVLNASRFYEIGILKYVVFPPSSLSFPTKIDRYSSLRSRSRGAFKLCRRGASVYFACGGGALLVLVPETQVLWRPYKLPLQHTVSPRTCASCSSSRGGSSACPVFGRSRDSACCSSKSRFWRYFDPIQSIPDKSDFTLAKTIPRHRPSAPRQQEMKHSGFHILGYRSASIFHPQLSQCLPLPFP